MGVGAGLAEVATDGKGRIEPAVLQGDDQHGGGGGLAMRAGNQQRAISGHQFGQHRRTQDHRNRTATGFHQFRIGLRDGGVGGDHRGRAARQQVEVGRVVTEADLRPAGPQRDHATGFLGVRTRDHRPAVEQDSRDTRHPGPADAHHVHTAEFRWHPEPGHRRAFRAESATDRTTSATRRAASRWPTPAAAAVMAASRGPSPSSRTTSVPT